MQEAGGGVDWQHTLSALGGAIVGALSTIGMWIYRAGGKVPNLRAEFQKSLTEAEKRVENKIESAEKRGEGKLDDLVSQFHESFGGMRRQFDEHKLYSEKTFMQKEDFKDFLRDEYRPDMRELKDLIASIAKRQ